jgi:hypothetical protein
MANQKFKSKVQADAGVQLPASTVSRALQLDSSGNLESSAVTTTELGYVSGVTSSLQTQLGGKASTTDLSTHTGASTGVHGVTGSVVGSSDTQTLTNKTIDADSNTITNIDNADIKAAAAIALNKLAAATASRALASDASGFIVASAVTSTELGHVSGVTSAIQTQINAKISSSEKGAANGVASLDGSGKVPVSQLPNAIMEYQGTWDASTNTPALANGAGNADSDIGNVYRASVAGSVDFGAGSISFAVGDYAILNSSKIWEKADTTDAVSSVNSQTGAVVLTTSDINEGTNLYYTDERAQDSVGSILVDSSSIDFTYNDGTPSITAVVLPAGVDHDSLQNFVANEHIDHTSVNIATAANSGLTGGGDISATRNLSVDINGTTAETSADNADKILIYDNSATALKSMTRANFLSGVPLTSAGDINESSFSAANNQAAAANVTGLAFANGTVRSFKALVSVAIDATADLFESFELQAIQKGSAWDMSVTAVGDDSGLVFSITTGGQVQYTSTNVAGFVSNTVKFRATTTSL